MQSNSAASVFRIFLRLGLTAFGGPTAHLGYFRNEFVLRRKWLTEHSYGDLVALCQFLPGPASSQVAIALGLIRCGHTGALAAWAGFTLPSAIALILFALGIVNYTEQTPAGLLHGLKIAAVAVVAQAVWGMARNLCTDVPRVSIMALACCLALLIPSVWGQLGVIVMSACAGLGLRPAKQPAGQQPLPMPIRRSVALLWLVLFFTLLITLPLLAALFPGQTLEMIDRFYRTGSLVFGGGHVVLPLLQAEVVPAGWVSDDIFLAGYGAAQAVPGPLFTFAAFLGSATGSSPNGWLGGIICLLAIFAPSFLLVLGTLPFWQALRHSSHIQLALSGINAGVVGLLLAALYQPVWTSAIHRPEDFALAVVVLVGLTFWKLPPWLLVIGSGLMGWLLNLP